MLKFHINTKTYDFDEFFHLKLIFIHPKLIYNISKLVNCQRFLFLISLLYQRQTNLQKTTPTVQIFNGITILSSISIGDDFNYVLLWLFKQGIHVRNTQKEV